MDSLFKPTIHFIYFDFDQVLASRTRSRATLVARLLKLPSSDALRSYYTVGFRADAQLLHEYLHAQTLEDEVAFYAKLFMNAAQQQAGNVLAADVRRAAEAFVAVPFATDPQAADCLALLHKHYRLGVFSNGFPSRHQEIAHSGLLPYFEQIVVSGDYGYEKPDQRLYAVAAQQAGVPPETIALVDDQLPNLAGAEQAGFGQGVQFTPAFWQRASQAST